jgi:hypothetical protein
MGTRPQTLYGLADSPVGQAAWLLDHGDGWSEPAAPVTSAVLGHTSHGHPAGDLTRDDVLDNITLYWLTGTAISAARLYWENKASLYNAANVSVPAAVSAFPGENYQAPHSWTQQAYRNLIYYNRPAAAVTSRPGNSRRVSPQRSARALCRCANSSKHRPTPRSCGSHSRFDGRRQTRSRPRWHCELLAAVETSVAEPGEQEYPGDQHDPADPEHPEDGGVRAGERVDQQKAQGEQGKQDPYPRGATPHSQAVAPATPAISVYPVSRSAGGGSGVGRPTTAGGPATGNSYPLAPLHLGELADVVAVVPCVLPRTDPARPQALG